MVGVTLGCRKLTLYLDHGWQLPKGFIEKSQKNPLNYTRAEWQQAARTNQNPKTIKSALQQCWARSDDKKSFEQALLESGYWLAKGDKRGYVAIDIHGEVYPLTRQLTAKISELKNVLAKQKTCQVLKQSKTISAEKYQSY